MQPRIRPVTALAEFKRTTSILFDFPYSYTVRLITSRCRVGIGENLRSDSQRSWLSAHRIGLKRNKA